MAIGPTAAAAAYQAATKLAATTPSSASAAIGAAGSGSFGDFLTGAMQNAVQTMQTGEQMAAKQVAGQADIVDVVNAVNSAELTLDTVVAVRDKVISAYQSIMQMPM
jgi:flagellar hook-basal body complex protein FliE